MSENIFVGKFIRTEVCKFVCEQKLFVRKFQSARNYLSESFIRSEVCSWEEII